MHTIEELIRRCEISASRLPLPGQPERLYAPIRYTMESGGKRIRPLLTLIGCAAFGGEIDRALDAATGIEVFHNFTLLHDDIMDKAPIRRGREAVYRRWNENVAILSGDAMMILAYRCVCKTDPAILPAVLEAFNRTAIGVCEGQQYDMDFETRDDVTVEQYLEMIRLKTSVLLGGAAQIGALIGGADPRSAAALYAIAVDLGLGFQLQDDLLDSFGDPATFGKTIGGDIVSNKKTYLLIKAFELADPALRGELRTIMAAEGTDRNEKIEKVKNIYVRTGAKQATEELVGEFFRRAQAGIESLPATEEGKELLRRYAAMLWKRAK